MKCNFKYRIKSNELIITSYFNKQEIRSISAGDIEETLNKCRLYDAEYETLFRENAYMCHIAKDYEQLQQENEQLKERVDYLERSNNRREDTIIEQRQEISNLEDNHNKLKKWIDSEIENRDSEDLLKLYVELQEDNEKLLSRIRWFKSQQKEFIKHLEDEIHNIEPLGVRINYDCEYDSEEDYINAMKEQSRLNTLKEILQKYKEIVGYKDE